jgi:acetyl-CoA C-acetyltransferase
MRESDAKAQGAKPLARVVAHATNSMEPALFTVAPVGAMQKVLQKAGWDKQQVDLWEINEAFAMVTMCPIDEFKLDPEKVNINGGACALGHSVGSTGSRIILTLIHALKRTGGKRGIAALCIGGGEAVALAVEVL